ncbi:kinase-like domain-containing protein [Glomus cerebriforme]|uniref:Kinase-like domain-containing protein n=1 Tax=Glomus cerebriforme TaxID=658196 RepID=A0A397TQH7_9GLOM|nr:kinase-like domain-containing protein [Glomus cerebriforme]
MDHSINYKHKIDFLLSNNTSLSQPTQTTIKPKRKIKILCNECNKKRTTLDDSHQICHVCYKTKTLFKPSGNKVIDDFIRHSQINYVKEDGKMEFVPYDQFKNIEFIAEGGFSKIFKATWIDGPKNNWSKKKQSYSREQNYAVVLKKLNNSKDIKSKDLNELKIFHEFSSKTNSSWVCNYFGITQDPNTQEIMIIMRYYQSGDLINYLTNGFFNIEWHNKLVNLSIISSGLKNIHSINILHRDLHSGNIFFNYFTEPVIGDLGISKSATESTDDNENYGIIPYMAPEIFQGQKYAKASDIYSFGMIMWEFMTGRRPFWDRNHDIELIIEICDGLRPPIVTNAPEGYIDLMKECWHSDPNKRPTAITLGNKIEKMRIKEPYNRESKASTKIKPSLDIGPVKINNPGAIYKSRPLSGMIRSAMSTMSTRSLISRSIISEVGK